MIYRTPAPRPKPSTFRVTRWARWWVRWHRKACWNRSLRRYTCRHCGLPFLAANDRIAECKQAACELALDG
jgi:hypothetical protein